jgi:hypothetical protein
MENIFSTVKTQLGDSSPATAMRRWSGSTTSKVFYNQRPRHSTLGQISPAAFECRATQAA